MLLEGNTVNPRTIAYCLIAALVGIAAAATLNLPGCTTTRPTPAMSTEATKPAITAQAENATETAKTLDATANAAQGHALAIVAATSTSDAAAVSAKQSAPQVAPQVATIQHANATIRTEAAAVQTNAGAVAAASADVFDYATSLKNANAALDKLVAERDAAKAEAAAAMGATAVTLRWCAAALGAVTLGLLAALFFSPFKPPMLAPVITGAAAAVLLVLAGGWVGFQGWAANHGPLIYGTIFAAFVLLLLALTFVYGWFAKAVGYAESLKLGADVQELGAKAKSTSGPLFTYAKHVAEKAWVKEQAWQHRTLHRNANHLAAAHSAAVSKLSAVVPVVPVNPTAANP